MTNYNELAKSIHENAVALGWWETKRSLVEIIALIHSEFSEALKEYREENPLLYYQIIDERTGSKLDGKKPEGIAVELADAVIRILDYCGKERIDIDEVITDRGYGAGFIFYTLPELVVECHYLLSMAYENINRRCLQTPPLYFAEIIAIIDFWVKENGGNLDKAIALKHEYNKGDRK